MIGYYLDNDLERENSYKSLMDFFWRKDFLSLLIGICEMIIENGEDLLHPNENRNLSNTLFILLNFKPKLTDIQHSYDDMFSKLTQEPLRRALYERMYSRELRALFPIVSKLPVQYESTEMRLAEMHFSGAIGLFDGVHDYEEERSQTARWFHFGDYKQIRAASSVEELTAIDAPETKLALVHILTGHYLDWYANLLNRAYNKAGFGQPIEKTRYPQKRLQYIIEALLTDEEFRAFLPNTTQRVPKSVKKWLLEGYCKKGVMSELMKLLNDIGDEFNIGLKSCSKKEFAQISWMVKEYCRLINITKYKTCKDLLTKYYGVYPTQYKVKDCSDYLKTARGKKLKRMIEECCESNEKYCYR